MTKQRQQLLRILMLNPFLRIQKILIESNVKDVKPEVVEEEEFFHRYKTELTALFGKTGLSKF